MSDVGAHGKRLRTPDRSAGAGGINVAHASARARLRTSSAAPLGATVRDGGVNFSVFSRRATGMELLLFDHAEDAKPARVVMLDPASDRTYHYWHHFEADA